ncbi:MAG: HAAS signaling domain-containing protein [Solirubrobacteraceae bacterium]
MTATVVATEVAAYLAAVRAAVADLGADERDDLLVEVEASLIETAGEDDRPIVERLGPPAEFAAELRASAGRSGAPSPSWRRSGGWPGPTWPWSSSAG